METECWSFVLRKIFTVGWKETCLTSPPPTLVSFQSLPENSTRDTMPGAFSFGTWCLPLFRRSCVSVWTSIGKLWVFDQPCCVSVDRCCSQTTSLINYLKNWWIWHRMRRYGQFNLSKEERTTVIVVCFCEFWFSFVAQPANNIFHHFVTDQRTSDVPLAGTKADDNHSTRRTVSETNPSALLKLLCSQIYKYTSLWIVAIVLDTCWMRRNMQLCWNVRRIYRVYFMCMFAGLQVVVLLCMSRIYLPVSIKSREGWSEAWQVAFTRIHFSIVVPNFLGFWNENVWCSTCFWCERKTWIRYMSLISLEILTRRMFSFHFKAELSLVLEIHLLTIADWLFVARCSVNPVPLKGILCVSWLCNFKFLVVFWVISRLLSTLQPEQILSTLWDYFDNPKGEPCWQKVRRFRCIFFSLFFLRKNNFWCTCSAGCEQTNASGQPCRGFCLFVALVFVTKIGKDDIGSCFSLLFVQQICKKRNCRNFVNLQWIFCRFSAATLVCHIFVAMRHKNHYCFTWKLDFLRRVKLVRNVKRLMCLQQVRCLTYEYSLHSSCWFRVFADLWTLQLFSTSLFVVINVPAFNSSDQQEISFTTNVNVHVFKLTHDFVGISKYKVVKKWVHLSFLARKCKRCSKQLFIWCRFYVRQSKGLWKRRVERFRLFSFCFSPFPQMEKVWQKWSASLNWKDWDRTESECAGEECAQKESYALYCGYVTSISTWTKYIVDSDSQRLLPFIDTSLVTRRMSSQKHESFDRFT